MLTIGYAGTLAGYDPNRAQRTETHQRVLDWFWTYSVRNVFPYTRSGYFLFDGIRTLKARAPEKINLLKVDLWGMIDPLNKIQVEQMGLSTTVEISGYRDKGVSHRMLAQCDVLFLPMESPLYGQDPLFIPGKLFEYIGIAKPIMCLAEDSDCSELLKQSGLGIICSPFDSASIADKIEYLIDHRTELSKIFVPNKDFISEYSYVSIVRQMASIFDSVLEV